MKRKVFISTSSFGDYSKVPFNLLRKNGIVWDANPLRRTLSETEISTFLSKNDYCGLLAGTEPLTERVLRCAPTLRVISRVGVGTDNIDREATKKLGVKLYTTSDVLVDAVAELTVGLILCCLRKITVMDRNMRNAIWRKEMGELLRGKIVGIIGFGKIGKRVAELLHAFGVKLIFSDELKMSSPIAKQVILTTLLSKADIISIHASCKKILIGAKELSLMKKGALLVNTARGSLVEQKSLYRWLRLHPFACAALDVFETEPYKGKLCRLENIVLTSHIGSYAREARIQMEVEATKNLIKGLQPS